MPFPEIAAFPLSHPGPYERGMGKIVARLLDLFRDRVLDADSAAHVAELAATPDRWSAGHAMFDEVRRRTLAAIKDKDRVRSRQYGFEEVCCKALYNATVPHDPFDPSSPFFVTSAAFRLAEALGLPAQAVVDVFAAPPASTTAAT
jgi:hypothetical protein